MPPQLLIHYVPVNPSASSRTLTDSSTHAGQSWGQFLASFENAADAMWWAWQDDNEDNVGVFACKCAVCLPCVMFLSLFLRYMTA